MEKINIIFEDNHLLVVEKPINIPVQKDSSNDMDMLTILKKYLKEKYSKPGNVYLGLVHRLDRPVGGIMVFAKTSKCASRLSEQIRENMIKKYYVAVVNGVLPQKHNILENYLYKDEKTGNSKIVDKDNKNAKYSKLEYEVIEENFKENISLIKILLYTGRHHQIRLQFNNIGNTLYGDQKYGIQDKKQIALWAYKLEFLHPITKQVLNFSCFPMNIGIWSKFDFESKLGK